MGKILTLTITLIIIFTSLFFLLQADVFELKGKDPSAETPPGPVISLEAISGVGKVLVTWSVPENGATYYRVFQGSDNNLTNATKVGDVTQTYWFDDNVVDGSIIFYFVEPVNDEGNGQVSFVVASPGIDSPPTSIRIDNDELLLGHQSFYGWPGVGSPSDPITIANLDLDAEGQGDGLFLGNTTYHVEICDGSVRNTTATERGDFTYSAGVALYNATNVSIDNMTLTRNEGFGVVFDNSQQCRVNGSLVNGSESGITLMGSSDCLVVENQVFDCIVPIEVYSSELCGIQDNEVGRDGENSSEVLLSMHGENCNVSGNIFHGNSISIDDLGLIARGYGIYLTGSGNLIHANTFLNCSITMELYVSGGLDGNQIFNNSVNGKPIYYYHDLDMTAVDIPSGAGEVLLYNCTNATVQGQEQNSSSIMVQAVSCQDIVIRDNTARDCLAGIWLSFCSGNVLVEDNVIEDCYWGIFTTYFDDNRISDNDISECYIGTYMEHWNHRNNVTGNRYENGTYGLFFGSANNQNIVHGNLFVNNSDFAVLFDSGSFNNMVFLNEFKDNNGAGGEYDEAQAQARDYKSDSSPGNLWQNGTNGPGNLWSDLTGPDVDLDGFVDVPYPVKTYPFMGIEDLRPLAYLVGPPGRVYDLNASAMYVSVKLHWEPANNSDLVGVDGYNVYRWNHSEGWEHIATVPGTDYLDEGLAAGVGYSYQVSAYNQHGEGPRSGNATASPYTVPGVPTGLQGDIIDGVAHLSWAPPTYDGGSTIDHYVIYLNGVESKTVSGTSAELSGLSLGVSYILTVRAHNAAGLGGASDGLTLIEKTVPNAPDLSAIWGDRQVALAWTTPYNGGSPITGYMLYKQWPGLSNWTELGTMQGNEYTDEGLTNGQTYAYKVGAVNSIGDGMISNIVRDHPCTLPSAPELYALEPLVRGLFAIWAAPDDDGGAPVLGYKVYLDGVLYSNTSADNITITGLEGGISYSVTVLAYNLVGSGNASAPMSAMPVSVPGPIRTISASSEPNRIVLDWSPAQGGDAQVRYRVYHRLNGSMDFVLLTTTGATDLTIPMSLQEIGLARDYKVEAFNSVGVGGNATALDVMPNVVFIAGSVLDDAGAPVAGATVISHPGGQVITGADGSFTIQVQPGTVVLNITKAGFVPVSREVWVGTSPVQMGTVTMAGESTESTDDGIDPIWVLVPVSLVVGGAAAFLLSRRKR